MGKDLAFESHWQGLRTTCIVTWGSSLPVPEPHSLLRFLRGSEEPEKPTPLCLTRGGQQGWLVVPRGAVDNAGAGHFCNKAPP